MTHTENDFDVLVIGGGAGGSSAAISLATNENEDKPKLRVALVERHKLGGTCLNYGCDPTKTLLNTARLLHRSHQAARYGLQLGAVGFDWNGVVAHVERVQKEVLEGTQAQARQHLEQQGIKVWLAEASFVAPHEIKLKNKESEQTIRATNIIIATGTRTAELPIEGLKETGYITNVEAVQLPKLPDRLAIIGGGPIGVEFAQMFRRFGVDVTVLEHSPTLLSTEDQQLAQALSKILAGEGIRFETGIELQKVERDSRSGKRLTFTRENHALENLVVDEILLAAGRAPNLEGLNLEAAGVETNAEGIKVDKNMRSSVPHIWAAGDITGGLQFTHVAEAQAQTIAHNITAKEPQPFDDRVIPWVTYTDPELAHVGQTEEQLQKAKIEYKVSLMQFSKVERAKINDETAGMVKLLVGQDHKILGGHILGAGAGELLAPIVLAMKAELPVGQLASLILPYPTLGEAIKQAAGQI